MGEFGYNETVWVISDECALCRTSTEEGDVCCVCRKKIKTKTCFKLDELYYCCNEVEDSELEKRFCWNCAKKLVLKKEIVG